MIGVTDNNTNNNCRNFTIVGKRLIPLTNFCGDSIMSDESSEIKRYVIDRGGLPPLYPTNLQSAQFWEHLGRAVATFSFLEEVLKKAIFAFTATRRYASAEEVEAAYETWLLQLRQVFTDQLWNLAEKYGKAVRNNAGSTNPNIDTLVDEIKESAKLRNILCHGAWHRKPDEYGRSVPFFIDKNNKQLVTPIDIVWLRNIQRHVAGLTCTVIDSVTHMGWQFPGSTGPGKPIWDKD